jgi:GAF domain-containing protein
MATALQENRLVINNNPTGNLKTVMVVPLDVAGRSIGTMNIGSKTAYAFAPRDENLLLQIASLLAARIENLRLFTEAQARAERERRVRTITDKIRRATDREQILEVARQELGEMLGAKESAVQLGTRQQLLAILKRGKYEET